MQAVPLPNNPKDAAPEEVKQPPVEEEKKVEVPPRAEEVPLEHENVLLQRINDAAAPAPALNSPPPPVIPEQNHEEIIRPPAAEPRLPAPENEAESVK